MTAFTLYRRIDAPIHRVFAVFTDWEHAADRIEAIERVEVVTDGPVGRGTKLRETRTVLGQRVTEEMEIIRFEPDEGYVVSCESHGCVFTTGCLMVRDGDGTKAELAFECAPQTLAARLKIKLMLPVIKKEFEKDFDQLKAAAEATSG